jgi:hypothetical protein
VYGSIPLSFAVERDKPSLEILEAFGKAVHEYPVGKQRLEVAHAQF